MTRRYGRSLGVVVILGGAVIAMLPQRRRMLRHIRYELGRRSRYAEGRMEGLRYRVTGGQPDLLVDDDVLADRVRSMLGPVEKRLDLPRVHVMVDHHVVVLHGDVGSRADAVTIERATAAVPGVMGVRSCLHVGLLPGDSRPSAGHGHRTGSGRGPRRAARAQTRAVLPRRQTTG
jgi:hypothetical protein